jgi:hypothetical protein
MFSCKSLVWNEVLGCSNTAYKVPSRNNNYWFLRCAALIPLHNTIQYHNHTLDTLFDTCAEDQTYLGLEVYTGAHWGAAFTSVLCRPVFKKWTFVEWRVCEKYRHGDNENNNLLFIPLLFFYSTCFFIIFSLSALFLVFLLFVNSAFWYERALP